MAARRHWRQHRGRKCGGSAVAVVAAVEGAACRQRGGNGGQHIGSAMAVGMAAAATVLPPRAAAVGMKTTAVTVMVGAQTTINNQLNASTATATETATTMTMETKATAATEARPRHFEGGGQLAAAAAAWQERGVGSGGSVAVA